MTIAAKAFASDSPPQFRVGPLDQRIAEMRRVVATMKHASASDTLRILRERFPDIPLRERMRAISQQPG